MSDRNDDRDDLAAGEADAAAPAGMSRKLSRILLYGGVLLLLAGGAAGTAWHLGLLGPEEQGPGPLAPVAEARPSVFYDLPEITVNLAATDQRAQFLRLRVALEVDSQDAAAAIMPVMPRVLDTFQVYLRELRSTDLEGSAGIYRLKEELRRRINLAVHPARVNDVLFKEFLVQ